MPYDYISYALIDFTYKNTTEAELLKSKILQSSLNTFKAWTFLHRHLY